MSSAPLVRDPDLSRLLDDGYVVVIQAGHLIVKNIPYVDQQREIKEDGFLAYPVTMSGDRIVSETDHRIWFGGSRPCDEHGRPLSMVNDEVRPISDGLTASFMLSSKPPSGYADQYSKVNAYARMVAHPAQALDPSVTPTPGAAFQEIGDDLPFHYRDTATSRAGLAEISGRYLAERVAIIGLGGTGGYILDQVAKTPVEHILLVDGDTFENHNAFRAPGAPSLKMLQQRPKKVAYFADIYSLMHKAISTIDSFLDEDNLDVLEGSSFVFLALDDADAKVPIINWLEQHDIPFIDVGMGIEEVDGHLTGLLRVTTSLPGRREATHTGGRLPAPAPYEDDYGRNIQTADLNAMNAMLAVIRWKRHLGCYADLSGEVFSTYAITTNETSNEDLNESN